MSFAKRRLILADDNIRTIGGHFFELASLLLHGGEELGLEPVLATHKTFQQADKVPESWQLHPLFSVRRMLRWSLGVDGDSCVERDFAGRPVNGSPLDVARQSLRDRLCRRSRHPRMMIQRWASEYASLLKQLSPETGDRLVLNTADDFALIGLANALAQANLDAPVCIDAVFHFAVRDSDSTRARQASARFGSQVRRALAAAKPHTVRLHATTDSLARQMTDAGVDVEVNLIPYPTRPRTGGGIQASDNAIDRKLKIVLAGLPRAEKGRAWLPRLLADIEAPCLRSGRFQVSLQLPKKRWQQLLPESMVDDYLQAVGQPKADRNDHPMEVVTANLSTSEYHQWLDTADIGLFLYEPHRYVARCSGVLLEMFVRGIPVIVPDRCWLADQVRQAATSTSGPPGLIYNERSQIPAMLLEAQSNYTALRRAALGHAEIVAATHCGRNTLLTMWGNPAAKQPIKAGAGYDAIQQNAA